MAAAGRKDAPAYFYMVAPPGEEETYLKGIEDVIGRVPFFGGSAADNSVEGKWKVLYGLESYGNGLGVVFFYTSKKAAFRYTGEYKETPKAGIIQAWITSLAVVTMRTFLSTGTTRGLSTLSR